MSSLQLTVALLCLFSLLSAALGHPTQIAQINKVLKLAEDNVDLSIKYWSSHDFNSKVLDKGLQLVEQMHELMHEYGVEEQFPPVAEFVEDLKIFLEDTKVVMKRQMNTMAKEYGEKENKMKALLTKLLK